MSFILGGANIHGHAIELPMLRAQAGTAAGTIGIACMQNAARTSQRAGDRPSSTRPSRAASQFIRSNVRPASQQGAHSNGLADMAIV